jgi:hypothetical protein
MTPAKLKKNTDGIAWAWRCDFGICHWAEPGKADLIRGGKPSPEAKAIKVRIVPYRRNQRTP